MKWLTASLVVAAISAGCHAPKPSFNVLAPYGSSRVPPPATSSTATANAAPYYNPAGGAPAASTPANAAVPAAGQRTDASNPSQNPSLASSNAWQSVQMKSVTGSGTSAGSDVALTAFTTPDATGQSGQSASNSQDTSSLKLGGMPVNDATQPSPASTPGAFVPAAGASPISALPAPPTSPTNNTVSSTAQASDQARAGETKPAGQATLQWK